MSPHQLLQLTTNALNGAQDATDALTACRDYFSGVVANDDPIFFGTPVGPSQPSGRDRDFEEWWSALPSEMKVAKQDAMAAWRKMYSKLPPVQQLIRVTLRQVEIRKQTGQGLLYPATFLRKERWSDPESALMAWGGNAGRLTMTAAERESLDHDPRFSVGCP